MIIRRLSLVSHVNEHWLARHTIIEILWFRVVRSSHHCDLDLLKALALDASSLLQSLLCVGELFILRNTISLVPLLLEPEILPQ